MKRISIAVHGRFHAFDLAAALLRAGADVELLTNYPKRSVARWFPPERTHSFIVQGMLARLAQRLSGGEPPAAIEGVLKRMFGHWAAHHQHVRHPDVIHCWSGVAEETLRHRAAERCTVTRGSAHIAAQYDLLVDEEARAGKRLEKPSQWIMARETREYELADRIIVPSTFAKNTFIDRGVLSERVRVVNLSLRATGFIASDEAVRQRVQRIRSGAPLRILYTGMLSYRKGMHDMRGVLARLAHKMEFRLVGPVLPECEEFARSAAQSATVQPAIPQLDLPSVYAWGDVFLLPTIEDGFAVVLAQAQAAGLPILCTTNCGGPDIIASGGKGWVVPIRSPEQIVERLMWCDDHRTELAEMIEQLHAEPPQRNWDDVARDFLQAVA